MQASGVSSGKRRSQSSKGQAQQAPLVTCSVLSFRIAIPWGGSVILNSNFYPSNRLPSLLLLRLCRRFPHRPLQWRLLGTAAALAHHATQPCLCECATW